MMVCWFNSFSPFLFLQNLDLTSVKEESIVAQLPDVSIAYKLHMECGKLINLFDWLQVCRTRLEAEKGCQVKVRKGHFGSGAQFVYGTKLSQDQKESRL